MDNNIMFKKICATLYQDALTQEQQWAKQIRQVEPNLKGNDQEIIHNFFTNMVSKIALEQVGVSPTTGKDFIKAVIEVEYLKNIKYFVDDYGFASYTVSNARLGAIRSLLKTRAEQLGVPISSKLLDDDEIFNLVAGWVWEDLTERILERGIKNLTQYIEDGNGSAVPRKPEYSLQVRSNKQGDMVINFDIDMINGNIPLNLDVKRSIDTNFHIGDQTYSPIQIKGKITDDFNLADFLKTEIIKGKMQNAYPVFLSISGGMKTLLSSELLNNPDGFYLKDANNLPDKEKIYEMAEQILHQLSDPQHPNAKEVKQIANSLGYNMIKGSLWYGRK